VHTLPPFAGCRVVGDLPVTIELPRAARVATGSHLTKRDGFIANAHGRALEHMKRPLLVRLLPKRLATRVPALLRSG
jgi:hypothetical protein